MKKLISILVTVPIVFTTGCSALLKQTAIDSTGMIIEDAIDSFFEEPDVIFAREAVPANLKLIEGLVKGDPDNDKLLIMASRFFASYAFGFIEEPFFTYETEDQALANNRRAAGFYRRSMDYGFRVLNKNNTFKETLNAPFEEFEAALKTIGKDQVAPLFWTAYAWGNLINLSKGDPDAIVSLGRVELMMKRVMELDETFFHGGPHLFYLVYYASRPPLLGGNPEKAEYHYNKAREISGGKFLMTDFLYAVYYAVQTQNRELYEQLLNGIIEAPADIFPDERLTNEITKLKAQSMLDMADELF